MPYLLEVLISIITIYGLQMVHSSVAPCRDPLLAKCSCGETEYINKKQYVVNCTDAGFTNTKPLERLPNNTQVLIFIGNNVPELPINVFGTQQNNSRLRVVDMSSNKIKVIHGKAFHKVSTVERLILNHNELTVDEHFRVFSNFENLLELHLTNAFADDTANLSSHLHRVFLNSDLSKLRKLHLEQNEIKSFKDEVLVFCPLNSLLDLHLGQNKLEHIQFRLDCLKHLRFIDLEGNNIVFLTSDELTKLDIFPKRNQSLMVDFSNNPFSCGYQIDEFYSWLSETKVDVRNKYKLRCRHSPKDKEESLMLNGAARDCKEQVKQGSAQPPPSSDGTVIILSLLLGISVGLLIYTNREPLKTKILPVFLSLSRKVHYTTIGKPDVHEMEV